MGNRRRGLVAPILALMLLPANRAADAERQLAALSGQDARLAAIGHRLATRNQSLCSRRSNAAGWVIHSLGQYGLGHRAAAQRLWRLDTRPTVAAVVPQGAADRAGVRPGDRLIEIDDAPFVVAPLSAMPNHEALAAALATVDRALEDGSARVVIERSGRVIANHMTADPACPTRFEVVDEAAAQARADGDHVQVASGLMSATVDDGELAAAVAHELAHNLLCHRARLATGGIDPSRRAQSPAARVAIRRTELEADVLSVTLLANAGYDPSSAQRLWMRLAREKRRGSGTHPPSTQRIAALAREAQRVTALRDADADADAQIALPAAASPLSACAVSSSQR